ncbi:MAG: phosphoribosyltransferase family protein [bacterium]|nr:phosphoribosyltransferase family protein [bacterium]
MKKLSWKQAEKLIEKLGGKIKKDRFKPDYIIGITTGGLIPLYFLAKQLDINNILTISASSYEKNKRKKKTTITYLPRINLKNQRVLLVDEVAETGKTLKKITKVVIKKYKPREIKTATIAIHQEKCAPKPNYWIIATREWLVFPWEKKDFPEYFR